MTASFFQSVECQRADWPTHKPICNANYENRLKAKQIDAGNVAVGQGSLGIRDGTKFLKKWTEVSLCNLLYAEFSLNHLPTTLVQVFQQLLEHAVVNALHLQQTPDVCQTSLLVIKLKPSFSKMSDAASTPLHHHFLVEDAYICSINAVHQHYVQKHPQISNVIACCFKQSEELREKGGIGHAFVVISVEILSLMQFTPLVFPQRLDTLPYDGDWLETLKAVVTEGDVDEYTDKVTFIH